MLYHLIKKLDNKVNFATVVAHCGISSQSYEPLLVETTFVVQCTYSPNLARSTLNT
ncbi:MAG: hypothetical protein V7780_07510 [Colwellia sp.]|jgi:hypothetical protein|uniref:hypothetical protein n=1 Tax=Colwellia sp. Bg11-12 TaxID=2759817 RepID=UPI0015F556F9|nr:hypothetical protein [Colwellia sp. Bg11-12]MBA6265050.1 hypothetical protein [Colwellia sp. Bg11-12]